MRFEVEKFSDDGFMVHDAEDSGRISTVEKDIHRPRKFSHLQLLYGEVLLLDDYHIKLECVFCGSGA